MPPRRKGDKFRKQFKIKPKRKEKFNFRAAPYIKEREARNKEIENRRKLLDEYKKKQEEDYDDVSEEEEENPLNELLKTFGNDGLKKVTIVSESESDSEDGDEEEEVEEELIQQDFNEEGNEQEDMYDDEQENLDKEDMKEDTGDEDTDDDQQCEQEDIDDDEQCEQEDSDEEEEKDKIKKSGKSDLKEKYKKDKIKLNEKASSEGEEIQIYIEDKNEEDEETAKEDAGHVNDPFTIHLRNDLSNELYQAVSSVPVPVNKGKFYWSNLGCINYEIPKVETSESCKISLLEKEFYAEPGKVPELINKVDYNKLYIKSLIQGNISRANYNHIKDNLDKNPNPLTSFQKELYSIINNYQDLLYSERTFDNESQIRFVYCLHAVNHVLKTRTKVLHHNAKIKKAKLRSLTDIPDEYKDQGLVRPKILILLPFRHSCYKVVEMLISIFVGEAKGGSVINKIRFTEDFGSDEIKMPKKNPKPEDYEKTFAGNTDDSFKIGISITKKAMKLYSDFYSADIIISSVLGLRLTIGAEGEETRDYDFLASIELLIMDQPEIFLMQNWDHVLHIFKHLHLQPKNARDADFSRLRSWCVNGWTKYYRQTLIFSSIHLPEIYGIFNKFCNNYAGKLKVVNPVTTGTIIQIAVQVPQVFHKFNVKDYAQSIDARFEFFTTKVLPQFKDSLMNHTLIFVPSYYDYVKLRNYFRNEDLNFAQICEYSRKAKVARARDMFFHSDAHFLLYTERYHFFRRVRVKGIRHIIFYSLPVNSHFYSEMCNLMQEGYQNPRAGSSSNMSITTIYCKYDFLQLSAIVGSERANKMIVSEKTVHMLMNEM